MNCRNCGAPLPGGTSFCPTCGATVSTGPNQNTPSAPYAPTVAAPPYGSPAPAQQPPSGPGYAGGYDPTIAAQPYSAPQQPASGGSGSYDPTIMAQPYSAPQQQASTAYGGPSGPYDPYSASASAAPPPPPPTPYGQAPIATPGYAPQPGTYMPPAPVRKKSNLGLIITLVVLAVVVACGGGTWLLIKAASTTSPTTTNNGPGSATTPASTDATPTVAPTTAPTTAPSNGSPTQADIVPDGAAFFAHARSASAVNSNFEPTQLADTFKVNQTVYVTFDFNNESAKTGYIGVKWYLDGNVAVKDKIDSVPHSAPGMFSAKFFRAGDVTVGLYWCTKSDCSDGQLGAVVNLTVQ